VGRGRGATGLRQRRHLRWQVRELRTHRRSHDLRAPLRHDGQRQGGQRGGHGGAGPEVAMGYGLLVDCRLS